MLLNKTIPTNKNYDLRGFLGSKVIGKVTDSDLHSSTHLGIISAKHSRNYSKRPFLYSVNFCNFLLQKKKGKKKNMLPIENFFLDNLYQEIGNSCRLGLGHHWIPTFDYYNSLHCIRCG